jgi:hypothetical protein
LKLAYKTASTFKAEIGFPQPNHIILEETGAVKHGCGSDNNHSSNHTRRTATAEVMPET